ncbi:ALDH-like protein [Aspergillus saccharolyticus JOP 1030-1]|uniref:ALDH-like protein n=1 Tax=Aspergillus saccharolyticus JOP 1030-1 TaxID=1450539 RepID=A0A318YZM7_9EURO|nr:ALDH-like protein [Aspergillus saccharolyticus JOP 1030-1]PYH40471.1 ALDH-like protein [Aspergillus saccharolyticus JOP 1030-1]
MTIGTRPFWRSRATRSADCELACHTAWRAFSEGGNGEEPWKRASVEKRRALLHRVADLFLERQEELLSAQIHETSCPMLWAKNNVNLTVQYLREIAACLGQVRGEIPPNDKPNTMAFVFKEPVGGVLVIPPWNAALILCTRAIASAVAAGCTVVLKASELCPYTHSLVHDIFVDAGAPLGVINLLMSARSKAAEVTEWLISHPAIRKIDFIGSAAVGRMIGACAAKYLKPVLLELGGKCPAIVLDDADIYRAAEMCARGAFLHHGQICFSTERIIVHKAIAESFTAMLVQAAGAVTAQGMSGRAITEDIAQHAYDVVQDAASKGCRLVFGKASFKEKSSVALEPTIIGVDTTSPTSLRIIDEESFGPSVSLYIVNDDEEAIKLANQSAYGLNASIHTRDMERGLRIGHELEYGQVHLNFITIYTSPTGPQGGVKGSGWGRQNAIWGVQEFLQDKSITWHG